MVADGKITPEEADRLLSVLRDENEMPRFFKVRVYVHNSEKPKVKVDIPIGALKLLLKLGAKFQGIAPEAFKMNIHGKDFTLDEMTPEMIDKILDEIGNSGRFNLVEFEDPERKERVEVYIE